MASIDYVDKAARYYDRYGNYYHSRWYSLRWLLFLILLIPLAFLIYGAVKRQRSGHVVAVNQGWWKPGSGGHQQQNYQAPPPQYQANQGGGYPQGNYNNVGDYGSNYQEGYGGGNSYGQANQYAPPLGPPPDDYAPPPGPPPVVTKN